MNKAHSRGTCIAIAALGVALAGLGATTLVGTESARPNPDSTITFVSTDRMTVDSVQELAKLSAAVARGHFTEILERTSAVELGLAGAGEANPAMVVWEFVTSEPTSTESLRVIRYDPQQVDSDEASIAPGAEAVLFLSEAREGRRVVVGGDQGLLWVANDGRLVSAETGHAMIDAKSVDDIQPLLSSAGL